jgi:phosphate transport system substrate-binding protein
MRAIVAVAAFACGTACAQAPAALPDYRPDAQVTGAIRSWGSTHMASLLERWEEGFRKFQPGVVFVDTLKGTASAQFALHTNVADIALSGRELYPYEYYGIFRRSQLYPLEFEVATGSLDVRGKSTALGVFVHRDNPLAKLTLRELDGIFGAERAGGWNKIVWDETVARGPEGNIRAWGRLGLTGAWSRQPIHVYGPPGIHPGGVSFFQMRVLGGGDTRNEDLVEFEDRKAMLEALARDRLGIAYAPLAYSGEGIKVLALADKPGGPFVQPTRASVASRAYPLSRSAYIYVAPDTPTGDRARMDPKVREFLRYVFSRQGQEDVEREGDHLPLTPALAREQLRKID